MRWNWILGLALAVLPFAGGQLQESLSQPTNTDPAVEAAAAPKEEAAPTAVPDQTDPVVAEQPAEEEMVDAAVEPISTAKPLPAGVKPTGSVAEVLKLVDSAVDEGVMLAFVTNSTTPFNLGVEEIIYLNDIGVPSAVVTAMIQRDQVLKALPGERCASPCGNGGPDTSSPAHP